MAVSSQLGNIYIAPLEGTIHGIHSMRVNGREKLQDFISRHAQAKSPIQAWLREVEQANWQETQDIKNNYRSASFLSDNRVVFNLGGNKFRLLVVVAYVNGVVLVKQVGTHAEYNRWKL